MWPVQRVQLAVIIALATGAILVLSQRLTGGLFIAASVSTIATALWFGYRLYRRTTARWVEASYQLMGDAMLPELLQRVNLELGRASSPVSRGLLQVMRAETLLWSGELSMAIDQAAAIDVTTLHPMWHRPVWGTQVAALMFLNRPDEAKAMIETHRAVLDEAPGFHQLEAAVAMSAGEIERAHQLMSLRRDDQTRPRLLRAARAMLEGELALRRHETDRALALLGEAIQLGGSSMIPARASRLLASIAAAS